MSRVLHVLAALAVAAICLASSARASAKERGRVVVFGTESGPAPAGFTQALAIQCAQSADVVAGPVVAGAVSDKLAGLERSLAEQNAAAGIWVERVPSSKAGSEFLVYVASRQHDRVLVQVVRLPGRDEPETDRALALKVREVLDVVLSARDADVGALVAAPAREGPAAKPRESAPGPALGGVVFAGLALASAGNGKSDAEFGASVGGGLRFGASSWLSEVCLELRPMSGVSNDAPSGSVRTREIGGRASLHALLVGNGLAAGLELGAGSNWVHATGTAPDGRSGEATRWVPFVYVGPEARLGLTRAVWLRLGAGLELALRRQRFSVLEREVVDLGSVRGAGDLSVLVGF